MNGKKFSVRDCNKAAKQQTTNTKLFQNTPCSVTKIYQNTPCFVTKYHQNTLCFVTK